MEHLARFRKSGRQAVRERAQMLMASVVYTPVAQIARICQSDEAHVRRSSTPSKNSASRA
jgi:hypothetical protein